MEKYYSFQVFFLITVFSTLLNELKADVEIAANCTLVICERELT